MKWIRKQTFLPVFQVKIILGKTDTFFKKGFERPWILTGYVSSRIKKRFILRFCYVEWSMDWDEGIHKGRSFVSYIPSFTIFRFKVIERTSGRQWHDIRRETGGRTIRKYRNEKTIFILAEEWLNRIIHHQIFIPRKRIYWAPSVTLTSTWTFSWKTSVFSRQPSIQIKFKNLIKWATGMVWYTH